MSWSALFECSVGSIRAAGAATTPSVTTGYGEAEQVAAYKAAVDAAATIGEAVGHEGDMVRVSLSGHANEGLEAKGNWTKDFASINVTRL